MQDGVHVRVGLDVVETDKAGEVRGLGEGERLLRLGVDVVELLAGEFGVQEVLDVVEGRVVDFVAVWKHVHLEGVEVDEDVVIAADRVGVGRTALASTLEVFAVCETGVDVVVREGDAAEPFKVEVEGSAIDLWLASASALVSQRR